MTDPRKPLADPDSDFLSSSNSNIAAGGGDGEDEYACDRAVDDSSTVSHVSCNTNGAASGMAMSTAAESVAQTVVTLVEGIAHTIAHWKVLCIGQVLSFLLASTGASAATLHFKCHMSAPATMGFFLYLLMSFHLLYIYCCCRCCSRDTPKTQHWRRGLDTSPHEDAPSSLSKRFEQHDVVDTAPTHYICFGFFPLHAPAWVYFIISLLHVEGNYFTFLALRYTTLTSVSLLDTLAIPSSMIFSKWFLRRIYRPSHLIGVIVCMIGVLLIVFADSEEDQTGSTDDSTETVYPKRLLGDCFAIMGGLMYGLNDVLTENAVKNFGGGSDEYLGMVGFFGVFISLLQAAILESDAIPRFFAGSKVGETDDDMKGEYADIDDIYSSPSECTISQSGLLLAAYATCAYVSYVGRSRFLIISEAALLNLSLLTGDLWSVAFTVIAEQIFPKPAFYFALILIMFGVVIYEIAPSPMDEDMLQPPDIKFRNKKRKRRGGGRRSRREEHVPAWEMMGANELELAVAVEQGSSQRQIT